MNDATWTKDDPSLVIIERDVIPYKSWEGLLPILKCSRWVSIDDEFAEGVTKKPTWIDIPKESTTIVTTRLRL